VTVAAAAPTDAAVADDAGNEDVVELHPHTFSMRIAATTMDGSNPLRETDRRGDIVSMEKANNRVDRVSTIADAD
jgi:hypothetical protein